MTTHSTRPALIILCCIRRQMVNIDMNVTTISPLRKCMLPIIRSGCSWHRASNPRSQSLGRSCSGWTKPQGWLSKTKSLGRSLGRSCWMDQAAGMALAMGGCPIPWRGREMFTLRSTELVCVVGGWRSGCKSCNLTKKGRSHVCANLCECCKNRRSR